MAPKCSICIHPQRTEIDRMLLDRSASMRDIAGRFELSRSALGRHKKNHLAIQMADVAERNADADIRTAIDVREQLKSINTITLGILEDARSDGDGGLALQAIDRIQKQIELQARLIDLLSDGDTVNVIVSPMWVQLRAVLLAALHPHPEAREAVAEALQSIEGAIHHDRAA